MKRDEWTFKFTAAKLADAAENKHNLHQVKFNWWEDKKSETMKKVAETGIEVQDSVASSYSNVKGGFGPEIKIDATLQRDLTECQSKILEHHKLMKEYRGWIQVLRGNPEAQLELDHNDYLFFFGE